MIEVQKQFNFKIKVGDGSEFNFQVKAEDEQTAKKKLAGYIQEVRDQIERP